MFKKLIALLFTTLNVVQALAASQVNYLNVDGNTVHFSLVDAKAHTIPSCATPAMNQHYGVSLLTEAGRAIYSLLITAMASKQAVMVESTLNCLDNVAVEQAKGVSISPEIATEEKSDKVQWAGYTNAINGKVLSSTTSGPFTEASKMCAAKYPDSRVMLWNDYVSISNEYPHTYPIWFLDAVQSQSVTAPNNLYSTIIYRNGQVKSFKDKNISTLYRGLDFIYYTSCGNWNSNSGNLRGIMMNTAGGFEAQACNKPIRLACVK